MKRIERDDSGMTVMEVVVATSLLMVVLAILLGVITSLTNNEARTAALTTNEQRVRFVLNDFSRDVRAADPLTLWTNTAEYRNKIQMEIGPTGSRQVVKWEYDPATRTLSRQVVSGPGAGAPVVRLQRVRNAERTPPINMLEYWDHRADDDATDELITVLPNDATGAAQIANCAIRVRITVTADSEPGPEPFTESLDVHVRNRLPGGVGC